MNKIFYSLILNIFLSNCIAQDYKHLFENKKILITGGTGFIGRALIDGILSHNPKCIVVFSRDEVKHAQLLEKFKGNGKIISFLGDIRNYESILYATKDMDLVIHAAALKRIDALEYAIAESIYTNVMGPLNVAKACVENKVETALLVSTDKACLPINTYGACKFISEKIFTNMFASQSSTRFLAVRYGNVLQSTGSAIPYFCEKIKNNQPIPLTHEDMTRFFITKEQAVELIFKAINFGQGGEVFVPKLPAFKIIDLIRALEINLGQEAGVEIIGLRPGEKIHEIMVNSSETDRTYEFKNMFVILPTVQHLNVEALYNKKDFALVKGRFNEYSSSGFVLSLEEVCQFLEDNNIVLKKIFRKINSKYLKNKEN